MAKTKRIWRESQHPRDARGRFARRGGEAWMKRAAAELTSLAGEAGNATRGDGGRPRISRNAKAGAVLQAHAQGGRPSAVRAPKPVITPAPTVNTARLLSPDEVRAAVSAPAAPKKRTPRPSPGAAAALAAAAERQAPHMDALRRSPESTPIGNVSGYAQMKRHTLVSLARGAGIPVAGKSNTELAEALAKHDADVRASRAARLNPSGVGVDTPRANSQDGGMTSTTPETPAAPGADTAHLKRPKAKKGDLVVVERKTSSYTIGKGHEEGTDVTVGVVTSTDRDGRVTSYSTNADGSYPIKVNPAREKTYKLEQERVDVQAAMAAAAANPWPHNPEAKGKPFESLAEARAAIAPHLGDQSAKVKADAAAKRAAAKRRPESEAKVTEAAIAMRQEKDYAKALRLIDEGEAADPDYKDKQGRGWGDFRKFVTARRDQVAKEQAAKDAEAAGPKESAADLAIGRELYQSFADPNRPVFDYAPSNAVRAAAEQAARDEVASLLPSGAMLDRTTLANRLASASGAVAAFTHQRDAKRAEIAKARALIAKIEDPEYRKFQEKEILRKLEFEEETLMGAIARQEADADRARADLDKAMGRGADRDKLIARRRSEAEDRAHSIANSGGRGFGDSGAGARIIAQYGTRPSSTDLKAMSQRDREDAQSELIMRGAHQDDLSKVVRSAIRNVDTKALTPEQRQAWIDATEAPVEAIVHTLAARQRRDLALSRLAALEAHQDRPSDAPELRSELDKAIAQERANLDYAQGELSTLEPEFQANLDRIQAAVNTVRATAGLKPTKLNTKALGTAYAKRIESYGITPQPNPPAPPAPEKPKTKIVFAPRKQISADAKRTALAPPEAPTPAPAAPTRRLQTFSERMAGDMSQADRLAAILATEERRQQLRAAETERARLAAEARANDTRSEREKLEEQLQQDRTVRDIGMRSGRVDPKREARIRAAEARLEEIRTEERKAQIKGVRKGDRVKTSLGEFEVVGKTSDGYLRVLRPDGRRGLVDPKNIETVTPAPKAEAAREAAPARARISPDAKRAAVDKANADATAAKRAANLDKARAAAKEKKVEELRHSDDPKDNAAKIRAILDGRMESVDLYRQAHAGPSGQRSNINVGRVRHTPDRREGEFRVVDRDGRPSGWVERVNRNGEQKFATYQENYDGGIELLGWADSLAHAADVLNNGEAAASTGGTLDARRISGRLFERNPARGKTVEQLDREALDREVAAVRQSLANPNLGPQQRASAERRLASLEAEQRGEPEPVDTPRVNLQNGGMTNATNTPQLGVTESSRGRTTTVTLPDGTTAQRTSKTMTYTHAVVATHDLHAKARDLRATAETARRHADAYEAWVARGANRDELVAVPNGAGSVNDARAGLINYNHYLPGFEARRVGQYRSGAPRYENQPGTFTVAYGNRHRSSTGAFDFSMHDRYASERGDTHEKTLREAREYADRLVAQAEQLEAGPQHEHYVARWSQRADTAFAAIGSPEVNASNTTYQVVTVGGVARQDAKPAKVVPTAAEKAAAAQAKKDAEKAERAARTQRFFDDKIKSVTADLDSDDPARALRMTTEEGLVSLAKHLKVKVPNRDKGEYGPRQRTREQVEAIRQSIVNAIRERQGKA